MFTLLAGAALVFLPLGWQINRFIVRLYYRLLSTFGWSPFSIDGWAVALNVLLFLVPVFLAALVWPRIRWWLWTVLGVLASGTVELVQMAYLPREASFIDWVANGSGALLGALAAHFLTHALGRASDSARKHGTTRIAS